MKISRNTKIVFLLSRLRWERPRRRLGFLSFGLQLPSILSLSLALTCEEAVRVPGLERLTLSHYFGCEQVVVRLSRRSVTPK